MPDATSNAGRIEPHRSQQSAVPSVDLAPVQPPPLGALFPRVENKGPYRGDAFETRKYRVGADSFFTHESAGRSHDREACFALMEAVRAINNDGSTIGDQDQLLEVALDSIERARDLVVAELHKSLS